MICEVVGRDTGERTPGPGGCLQRLHPTRGSSDKADVIHPLAPISTGSCVSSAGSNHAASIVVQVRDGPAAQRSRVQTYELLADLVAGRVDHDTGGIGERPTNPVTRTSTPDSETVSRTAASSTLSPTFTRHPTAPSAAVRSADHQQAALSFSNRNEDRQNYHSNRSRALVK